LDARPYFVSLAADEVCCSCLNRTRETAELLFSASIPPERQLAEFNEIVFGDLEDKIVSRGEMTGFRHSYPGDFVAFQHECHGDNPYRRAEKAIEKMQELSRCMSDHPQKYPNQRIAIVSSATLMGCIMLTLTRGHRWRKITSLPHPKNLEHIKFVFDRDTNEIVGFEFCGEYRECRNCSGTMDIQ